MAQPDTTSFVLAIAPTGETRQVPVTQASFWRSRGASIQAIQPTPAIPDATQRVQSQQPWTAPESLRQTVRGAMVPGGGMAGGMAGMGIGGMIGGPLGAGIGALLGAGLGGYTGRVGYEATSGRAPVPGMPQRALGAGGEQMVYEGLGLGAQPAMRSMAEGAMSGALRAERGVRKMYPTLPRMALQEGATVGLGGGARAEARREAASAATDVAIAAASKTGKRYSVAQIADEMLANNEREMQARFGRSLSNKERQATINAVRERANEILARRTGGILHTNAMTFNEMELDQLRQGSRDAAKAAVKKLAGGDYIGTDATLDLANERSARRLLDVNVPNRKALAASERRKIIVSNAVQNAEAMKRRGMFPAAVGGIGLGWSHNPFAAAPLAYAAIEQPEVLSLLAHILNNPFAQFGARQAPRLGGALIHPAQMPPDTTTQR